MIVLLSVAEQGKTRELIVEDNHKLTITNIITTDSDLNKIV